MTLQQFYDIIEDNKKNPDLIHTAEWDCPKCTFPFYDLTNIDLLNINTTDNIAIFNLMPEFSITSNVDKVQNLLNIDENLTDNINYKYSTHNDVRNLPEYHKAFNIFHADVNRLEPHFEGLHVPLANMKYEFSAICISETSQKFNENFTANVSIHGFVEPIVTETLISK